MATIITAINITAILFFIVCAGKFLHLANGEEAILHEGARIGNSGQGLGYGRWTYNIGHIRNKRQSTIYIDSIINYSNTLRRTRGSSNMFKMEWDPFLAKAAAEWVSRCNYKHGYPTDKFPYPDGLSSVGENLFATSLPTINTTQTIQYWFSESNYYDISGPCPPGDKVCGTCKDGKVCEHYTQVVWWNSYRIGCAEQRCDAPTNLPWSGPGTIFICYYAPPGNYIGQYPYLKGTACSACGTDPSKYDCDGGLCVYRTATNATTTAQLETTTKRTIVTTTARTTMSTTTAAKTTTAKTTVAQTTTSKTTVAPTTTAKVTVPPITTAKTTATTISTKTTATTTSTKTTATITSTKATATTSKATLAPTITEKTTAAQTTTAGDTTIATIAAASDRCGESTCANGCQLTNQQCCACRTYAFNRDCTCCPLGYVCCPYSPFFPRGAGCCPPGSVCRGDGSCTFQFGDTHFIFPGRSTTYATTPVCFTDPMLTLTADDFISGLYFNGLPVPLSVLPNRYYTDVLDLVPFPATVKVIGLAVTNFHDRGGILVRSTDGRVTHLSSWKCKDFSFSQPPTNWMTADFDDHEWNFSYVYFRFGVVKRGYPYYAFSTFDAETEWSWVNLFSGPGRFVYCRLVLEN